MISHPDNSGRAARLSGIADLFYIFRAELCQNQIITFS